MSRWLAGVFDPRPGCDAARLGAVFAPGTAQIAEAGALRVAYSGTPAGGDGGVLCLFDGHLDNAAELRRELGGEDAERSDGVEGMLAAGYLRWGRSLLARMRGDFVLLLWDRARASGLLARDQLGVRPCFVRETAGRVHFASELRDLLALLPTRPSPDAVGVVHWIGVSARPDHGTLYAGIERLPPGTALLFDRGRRVSERYWSPRFQEPLELPVDELAERIRSGLSRAVRRRLAPEGDTGVLMSGGLDSSAIAALGAEQADGRLQTCSATFPAHADADESELIAELGQALAAPRLTASVRPGGLLASALESVATWQAPLLGWGDFWTLPLMRAAARAGVTSMLGGDGGDELFGVRSYFLADRLRRGHPLEAWSLARRLPGAEGRPSRRQVAAMVRTQAIAGALPVGPHAPLERLAARRDAPAWLRPAARRLLLRSDDPLAWKRLDGPRWWAHAAHGVTRGIEQAGVFEHQRRRAALAGLEARHPMLDLDLVELCLRQPPLATFDPRFTRPLLRTAMRGRLPDSVRLRPGKARFESLIVDCLRGPDRAALELLTGRDAEVGAYVDVAAMRRALLESNEVYDSSPLRWMWQIWRLANAECWLRAQERSLSAPLSRASGADVTIAAPAPAIS